MPAGSAAADRAARIPSRPFTRLTLRGLTVPNRIVMASMTRDSSPGGVPGADVARYCARRAAGGVGLIVTEGTYVGHDSAGDRDRTPLFHGEDAPAGWKNVVAEVHGAGGRIMAQMCHVGVRRPEGSGPVPDAPMPRRSARRVSGWTAPTTC
ncbi:hypothetical protein HO151_01310 [Streptomyces sp. 8P21H-1]|nr:hypothetical protein [Streptomyces sp. 8P21H-1]